MNYATPLRGSELFNRAREEHWLDDRYLHFGAIDMTDYVLNVPNITGDKIKREMFLLNLDVNFVNNSSMARGDYKTAIKAFREVIFRHSNQPFAHYYISKCYAELSEPQLAADHFKTFERLVALDSEWYATAELFSLVPIARESFVSV
jgi:hypothetical protein